MKPGTAKGDTLPAAPERRCRMRDESSGAAAAVSSLLPAAALHTRHPRYADAEATVDDGGAALLGAHDQQEIAEVHSRLARQEMQWAS